MRCPSTRGASNARPPAPSDPGTGTRGAGRAERHAPRCGAGWERHGPAGADSGGMAEQRGPRGRAGPAEEGGNGRARHPMRVRRSPRAEPDGWSPCLKSLGQSSGARVERPAHRSRGRETSAPRRCRSSSAHGRAPHTERLRASSHPYSSISCESARCERGDRLAAARAVLPSQSPSRNRPSRCSIGTLCK